MQFEIYSNGESGADFLTEDAPPSKSEFNLKNSFLGRDNTKSARKFEFTIMYFGQDFHGFGYFEDKNG